jgi:hypothetical protein
MAHQCLTMLAQQLTFDWPKVVNPWHYIDANLSSSSEPSQGDLESICGMVRGHHLVRSPWLQDLISKSTKEIQTFTLLNEEYLFHRRTTNALDHGLHLSLLTYDPTSLAFEVPWVDVIDSPTSSDPSPLEDEEL